MLKPLLITAALATGAAAAHAAPAAPNRACAPAPAVDTGALARQKQAVDSTLRNFAAAYRAACAKGYLRNRPLIKRGSVPDGRIFLKNAPDANVASIYNEGEPRARPGRMVLEYPFVSGGTINVPTAAELEEAIFCAVVGVTSEEDEGRCLPD